MTISAERLRDAHALLAFSHSLGEGSHVVEPELRVVPAPAEEPGEPDLQQPHEESLLPADRPALSEVVPRQGKEGGACFHASGELGDCGGPVVNGYCYRHYIQAVDRADWRMGDSGHGRTVGGRVPEGTGHLPRSLAPRRTRPHQTD